jgi:hypothetical protein
MRNLKGLFLLVVFVTIMFTSHAQEEPAGTNQLCIGNNRADNVEFTLASGTIHTWSISTFSPVSNGSCQTGYVLFDLSDHEDNSRWGLYMVDFPESIAADPVTMYVEFSQDRPQLLGFVDNIFYVFVDESVFAIYLSLSGDNTVDMTAVVDGIQSLPSFAAINDSCFNITASIPALDSGFCPGVETPPDGEPHYIFLEMAR